MRDLLGPHVVDVVVEREEEKAEPARPAAVTSRNPIELFQSYLTDLGVDDERLGQLFGELLDDHDRSR